VMVQSKTEMEAKNLREVIVIYLMISEG